MKQLRFFDTVIFLINIVFAALLLFSYLLPYVFLKQFPMLSVLGLALPVLIIINIVFLMYWGVQLKKHGLLSFFILLVGFNYITSFYSFSGNSSIEKAADKLSVMTYNVRLFNAYKWIEKDSVAEDIITLIRKAAPDILCIQEFYAEQESAFKDYPYQYIKHKNPNQKNGQAIFSRFPVIHKGSLEFPRTSNNAIYVDVVKGKDTIRVYNLHLESLRIQPESEDWAQEGSGNMYRRMGAAFATQQNQATIFEEHKKMCSYKTIICGDFNNTQYSNVYRRLKKGMKDSFKAAGSGFGRTFNFGYFPIRIDFILADETMTIHAHKNYTENYSDHFPVEALLSF